MKRMDFKEGLEALRQAKLTKAEIERLCQYRRSYSENPHDKASVDYSRMEFIRWLIANKRLTDHII